MAPERDLFANFERMRRDIDELFGDVFERAGFAPRRAFAPRIDVYYCGKPPRAALQSNNAAKRPCSSAARRCTSRPSCTACSSSSALRVRSWSIVA